jgi:hypothetical protein
MALECSLMDSFRQSGKKDAVNWISELYEQLAAPSTSWEMLVKYVLDQALTYGYDSESEENDLLLISIFTGLDEFRDKLTLQLDTDKSGEMETSELFDLYPDIGLLNSSSVSDLADKVNNIQNKDEFMDKLNNALVENDIAHDEHDSTAREVAAAQAAVPASPTPDDNKP